MRVSHPDGYMKIRVTEEGDHSMKGQSLYAVWHEEMNKQGVSVQDWDELSSDERAAWNALAHFVQELVVRGVRG